MNRNSKIYIAGHKGLVGSAITKLLTKEGYKNLVLRTRQDLDLLNQQAVADFFAKEKPEYVFLAAAKVGGIMPNYKQPADFIYENLQIQNNAIHQSYLHGVKKLLFLGSICIYPKQCPSPIKEEYLLSGYLEPTSEPYAIAKIAGLKTCQSYNRQYGTNFISLMPANLYGPEDNFDLNTSHALPAFIRKFHDAKIKKEKEVTLWGTGSSRRDFLFVDDMADASLFLMNNYNESEVINIGTGIDISIKELVEKVKKIVGYDGRIAWDASKPDGAPKRQLDTSKLHQLGWQYKTELTDGLKKTYKWYLNNF